MIDMKNRLKKRQICERYPTRYARWTAEDRAWLDIAPVGREFGSKDYERLSQLDALADAAAVAANRVSESIEPMLPAVEESNMQIGEIEKRK
jgi:hypothetical protein